MSDRPRPWRLLIVALLAAALPLGLPAPRVAEAQGGGTVRIQPATLTIGAGGSGTVEVWLEGAAGYYGLDLRLAWDPAVASADSGQVSPLWEAFDPGSHMVLKNRAGWCDDGSGQRWHGAWYAVANVSPAPAFSGLGRVCAIHLTGLAPGTTILQVTAEGATNSGALLGPATAGATIVVTLATATATATCTATPSATLARTATPRPTASATRAPTPSLVPPRATATPSRTATPLWAGVMPRPTCTSPPTATAAPTPGVEEAARAEAAGLPALLPLLLPFLIGAVLTAGMLKVMRRRPGDH